MKAVSYKGAHKVAIDDRPKPQITSPTDAILRVTTSGICGSDLHMYDGRTSLDKGTVVGHEIMGVIDAVGEAVESIQEGDRVGSSLQYFLRILFQLSPRVYSCLPHDEPGGGLRRVRLCGYGSVPGRTGGVRARAPR
jgi:NADPH:quinone reductase-like Zn-dependent oxidoreductase